MLPPSFPHLIMWLEQVLERPQQRLLRVCAVVQREHDVTSLGRPRRMGVLPPFALYFCRDFLLNLRELAAVDGLVGGQCGVVDHDGDAGVVDAVVRHRPQADEAHERALPAHPAGTQDEGVWAVLVGPQHDALGHARGTARRGQGVRRDVFRVQAVFGCGGLGGLQNLRGALFRKLFFVLPVLGDGCHGS